MITQLIMITLMIIICDLWEISEVREVIFTEEIFPSHKMNPIFHVAMKKDIFQLNYYIYIDVYMF